MSKYLKNNVKSRGKGTDTGCVKTFQVRVRVRDRCRGAFTNWVRSLVRVGVILSSEVRRRVRVQNELKFGTGMGTGTGEC